MAQHDYVIDNASGAAVRADINSVLQAVLTNNSGTDPSESGTTAAYMLWADTGSSPNLLKIRDNSDGAWITICEISSSGTGTMTGGQSFFSNGTQALPSITFKNDPDSGMRRTDANKVSIVTNGSDQLTVDANGNVGIGSSTPAAELHVENDGGNCVLQLTSNTANSAIIRLGDTGQGGDANIGKIEYDNTDNSLAFTTNTNTRLTIDSDGNVGIAETTPTEVLHVNGNIKSTGTIFIGTDSTSPHSEDDGATERVRIQQDQISVAAVGAAGLFVNRLNSNGAAAKFFKDGTEVGSISVTGSATAYNESSDHRLKENIVDMVDGIARVKQLQPRRFNFIADAETTVDGFVAHEAQAVVPEAVTGTHNGVDENGDPVMQGIDKSKFVPLLTAALQEAIAKIETLEAKVAALEAAS